MSEKNATGGPKMRTATIFSEMQQSKDYPTGGSEFLFNLFQEAVETATGGAGLEGWIVGGEDGGATRQNAGALAIASAIAYAGKEIADAIRESGR